MKKNKNIGFSVVGFLLFFATIAVSASLSILIFNEVNIKSKGNETLVAFAVLGNIFFASIVCTVIDIFRRKIFVDNPVQKILEATEMIAKGNFDINLKIKHSHKNFDEYDSIMENINIMAKELSKNEVLKTDFISNVSHEIKTPLVVIQNYSKILQNDKLSKDDRKKFLQELVIASQRLSNLITNILKLNKLENQQLNIEFEKFNLGEELRQSVLRFEGLFEKKKLVLDCDIDDVYISSSKELLELVWNNLISNAIKFTESGGKISVKVKSEQGFATIEIADTGVGISKETGEHIFEKFYQGDTSHATEGNGLGLALVKKVIDILGGEILVESELKKGSKFVIKLKKDKDNE